MLHTIEQETGEVISTATITFNGTDTYFNTNTFDIDDVKIFVNGSEVTDGSITMTLEDTDALKEDRIENGVAVSDYVYGVQYKIKLEGFNPEANQVKIRIPKGVMVDKSGNDSEETDLIVYNVLKKETFSADTHTGADAFLGESVATTVYPIGVTSITPIARQDIEQIEFVSDLSGAFVGNDVVDGITRIWDVSAMGDKSILAWTSDEAAPYKVYVGSEHEIFANPDSSYLFSYIGYGESVEATATDTVIGLNLLREDSAINMTGMFNYFGYRAMTEFDLDDFDTRFVADMENMFNHCGFTAMTSLDLGENFDTSSVTDMKGMFSYAGATVMTSLDLGEKFDTSSVQYMNWMFDGCGFDSMEKLDLRDKFDTTNVTNMYNMFYQCGYKSMSSLDLGDKFNTSSVTDMHAMFYECGHELMTTLDLGAQFTHIADEHTDFMKDCGTTGLTIYAPESIYANKEAFK